MTTEADDEELARLDAVAQAELVRSGAVSSLELVESAIRRIERADRFLNALTYERFEAARQEASLEPSDAPFHGVPMLLKGLGAGVADEPDHRGSRALRELRNVHAEDSSISRRFSAAGFISLGRTNVPEFGLVSETQNAAYGVTCNPWSTAHSPNGSSGGSAAAVAAGYVPIAHGNDGGGSIRMPASDCGLVGLKPTRGRVSHAPSEGDPMLGHVTSGVLTRSVRDTALVMDILAGHEPGDPTIPPFHGTLGSAVRESPGCLRVGVVSSTPSTKWEVDQACRAAVEDAAALLDRLGHDVEYSHPPAMFEEEYWRCWFAALSPGVSSMVDSITGLQPSGAALDFDPVTMLWAERGWAMTATDLSDAIDWLDGYRRRIGLWWAEAHDVLLCPVSLTPPQLIGSTWASPASIADSVDSLQFCPQWNTTGQPAISIPYTWTAAGLPIGIQLIGGFGREDILIRLAAQLEEARPWFHRYPANEVVDTAA